MSISALKNKILQNGMIALTVVWLLYPCVTAATEVQGMISEDARWSLAGSPYVLTGDVFVGDGHAPSKSISLAIDPGVEVNLNGFHLWAGYWQDKNAEACKGRLVAEQVRFSGKGRVRLVNGDQNRVKDTVFDAVYLDLGEGATTKEAGLVQNVTVQNADITIYGGNWKIAGGKLINGSITHKNTNINALGVQSLRYLDIALDLL